MKQGGRRSVRFDNGAKGKSATGRAEFGEAAWSGGDGLGRPARTRTRSAARATTRSKSRSAARCTPSARSSASQSPTSRRRQSFLPGMLSKIENGLTSPSLTTLKTLSAALGVPVTAFFRRYEERRDAVFVRGRAGARHRAARHPRRPPVPAARPHRRRHRPRGGRALPDHADGEVGRLSALPAFRAGVHPHAGGRGRLPPRRPALSALAGDSLFFDADAPHGPEELTKASDPLPFGDLLRARRELERVPAAVRQSACRKPAALRIEAAALTGGIDRSGFPDLRRAA